MANTTTIILKNSGSNGKIPTSANLQFGELAINYADGILYYKAANGAVLSISGSAGGTGNGQAAYDQANLAYNQANTFALVANLAFDTANSANIVASAAFDKANSANIVASAAFDKANSANIIAVAAFNRANQQTNLAFSVVVANGTSLVADSNADTLTIRTTGNVAIIADAVGDNMTFDLTTTGVTAATYGSGTIIPVLTVDARGRLTAVSNVAITGNAQAAFDQANSAYSSAVLKTGNTMTGQLVMAVGTSSVSQNTGSIVVNGGIGVSGNVYISNSSSYGFANTSNVSVAKIQYNAACNSIDFVFD